MATPSRPANLRKLTADHPLLACDIWPNVGAPLYDEAREFLVAIVVALYERHVGRLDARQRPAVEQVVDKETWSRVADAWPNIVATSETAGSRLRKLRRAMLLELVIRAHGADGNHYRAQLHKAAPQLLADITPPSGSELAAVFQMYAALVDALVAGRGIVRYEELPASCASSQAHALISGRLKRLYAAIRAD